MIPSKSDPQTHGIQKNGLKLAYARQASKRKVSLESFQEMLYAWGVGNALGPPKGHFLQSLLVLWVPCQPAGVLLS